MVKPFAGFLGAEGSLGLVGVNLQNLGLGHIQGADELVIGDGWVEYLAIVHGLVFAEAVAARHHDGSFQLPFDAHGVDYGAAFVGGGDVNQLIAARLHVHGDLSRLDAEAVGGGYHALAVGGIVSPAHDSLAVLAPYRLFNDIVVGDAPLGAVDQVNPAVFDIQVVDDVDAHLGGGEFQ